MKPPKENVPSRFKERARFMNNINWACLGKDAFDTRDMAQAVITKMLRRREQRHAGRINTYRCDYCAKWHIGGQR